MENKNTIETTVEELKKLLNVKNFVGEPIETENKLMIPFMKWGFGFGAGQGNDDKGRGFGSGGGAGIEPISIVVIDKNSEGMEGIKVLNLSEKSDKNKVISDLGLAVTDLVKEILSNSDITQKKDNNRKDDNKNSDEVSDIE